MAFELTEAVEILRATPGTLRALLGDLSDPWVRAHPGADTWGGVDVLAHLVAGDTTDWIQRTRVILEHGTTITFEPFDREARPQTDSLSELLDAFADLRARNLAELAALGLTAARLDARGSHPAFGEVRLRDMLAAWAVHDLSHIAQASEAMAKRYADDVGPWRRYLPLLDRPEESSD